MASLTYVTEKELYVLIFQDLMNVIAPREVFSLTLLALTVKMSTNALATHVTKIVRIAPHLSLIPLDSFAAVELVIISMKTVFDAMTILNVLMVLVAKKMPAVQRPLVHIFVNAMMVTLQLTLPTALITMIYNAKI